MVRIVVDVVDVIVVGVLVVCLLLCGVVYVAAWIKQELNERYKK